MFQISLNTQRHCPGRRRTEKGVVGGEEEEKRGGEGEIERWRSCLAPSCFLVQIYKTSNIN